MSWAKLAALVLTILLVAVAGYLFYAWQQQQVVEQFLVRWHGATPEKNGTVAKFLDLVGGAPPIVCKYSGANFNNATNITMYAYQDRIRMDVRYITDGRVAHELFDKSGGSVWNDGGSIVYKMSPDAAFPSTDEFHDIVSSEHCALWSDPQESLFEVPQLLKPVPYPKR